MGRSRMFDGEVPEGSDRDDVPEGPVSPRTTIVGGRPPEPAGPPPPVPTGIQRLLRLAAIDRAFLEQLVEKRDAIAAVVGVALTPTESAVLRAASRQQLEAMAAHLPPPEPARRDFLRQSAATAVVLLGGAALAACEACGPAPGPVRGATADMPPVVPPAPDGGTATPSPFAEPPPPRPDVNDMQTEGGAAPDEPPPPPPPPYPPPGGARPDLPPERPEQVLPVAGVPPDMPPERPETARPTRGIRPDVPPERK